MELGTRTLELLGDETLELLDQLEVDHPVARHKLMVWIIEEKPALNAAEYIVSEDVVSRAMEEIIGEEITHPPYKYCPVDAYTKNSAEAVLEIKKAEWSTGGLDACSSRGLFVPHRKKTALLNWTGLGDGPRAKNRRIHFHRGYFCYLLDDGIYYLAIQQIEKMVYPGTEQPPSLKSGGINGAGEEGIFIPSEHWTKLEGSDATYPAST